MRTAVSVIVLMANWAVPPSLREPIVLLPCPSLSTCTKPMPAPGPWLLYMSSTRCTAGALDTYGQPVPTPRASGWILEYACGSGAEATNPTEKPSAMASSRLGSGVTSRSKLTENPPEQAAVERAGNTAAMVPLPLPLTGSGLASAHTVELAASSKWLVASGGLYV